MSNLSNVMLIDDDELTNHIHKSVISKLDGVSHIRVYSDANQALSFLKNLSEEDHGFPDCIFLDINMPKMNGWDFLDVYQNLPAHASRLFVLTSSIDQVDKTKAQSYTCVSGFISKPLKLDVLEELLQVDTYWT
ncbi:MAG: response regulator [Bacteroidota bacterium]